MEAMIRYRHKNFLCNLEKPLDIGLPLEEGYSGVNCFYAPPMEAEPVVAGDFIGSTARGGVVNFLNIRFNPHGNGTHTECVGHIAKEKYTINRCLRQFIFPARLVSLYPVRMENGDRVIGHQQIKEALEGEVPPALVIRTLPNDGFKQRMHYSGTNPPYIDSEAVALLVEAGVEHLLIDLPSVDREEDGGRLLAHKAFWRFPDKIRENCTITELIYVNNSIPDGLYLLNIQIAGFEVDASPSKPVLYALTPAD